MLQMGVVTEVSGRKARVRPDMTPDHTTDWLLVPDHVDALEVEDRVAYALDDAGEGVMLCRYTK